MVVAGDINTNILDNPHCLCLLAERGLLPAVTVPTRLKSYYAFKDVRTSNFVFLVLYHREPNNEEDGNTSRVRFINGYVTTEPNKLQAILWAHLVMCFRDLHIR